MPYDLLLKSRLWWALVWACFGALVAVGTLGSLLFGLGQGFWFLSLLTSIGVGGLVAWPVFYVGLLATYPTRVASARRLLNLIVVFLAGLVVALFAVAVAWLPLARFILSSVPGGGALAYALDSEAGILFGLTSLLLLSFKAARRLSALEHRRGIQGQSAWLYWLQCALPPIAMFSLAPRVNAMIGGTEEIKLEDHFFIN